MKRWYVIQVYAGYEELIKADLSRRIKETNLGDLFGEILIPSAKVKQFFEISQAIEGQQLFPGYILIEMDSTPEAIRLVTHVPRVLRLLGALTQKEVDRLLAQMRGEVLLPIEKHEFEVGKEIEIIEGPFSGFFGIIDAIDEANEKLTVMVSIFGRMTPVELGFDQIKH
ncbi:MAG: transcription termination/antitermination protein NusG [Candidatus Babeliaceae bacterium]